jgi:hypothetical protein
MLGAARAAGYHASRTFASLLSILDSAGTTSLLTPDHLAMMARGVSVIVSACRPDLTPSLMRAVGSQVDTASAQITVFLSRSQSAQLLRDVASSGRVAVVFSEPHSHRTVQVKSSRTRLREVKPDDAPALQRYLEAMQGELSRVGFGPAFAAAMLWYRVDDLTALEFTPDQAFDQTPGPRAGQPLQGAA